MIGPPIPSEAGTSSDPSPGGDSHSHCLDGTHARRVLCMVCTTTDRRRLVFVPRLCALASAPPSTAILANATAVVSSARAISPACPAVT